MPYYRAGDYYRAGRARGDYYRGNYQAGGLLGSIGKFIGGAAKKLIGLTPVGAAINIVAPALLGSGGGSQVSQYNAGPKPEGGIGGAVHRLVPGGMSGYLPRRRMNPTNVKALRRAGRRVKGFLKIASRLGALPVNRGKGKRLFKRKSK